MTLPPVCASDEAKVETAAVGGRGAWERGARERDLARFAEGAVREVV